MKKVVFLGLGYIGLPTAAVVPLHHMVFAMWKSQEMAVSFPISAV